MGEYTPLLNIVKCDIRTKPAGITASSSSSMNKGCHLQDHDGLWRTHQCEVILLMLVIVIVLVLGWI